MSSGSVIWPGVRWPMVLVLAMLTAMSVSWRLHQDGIALAADDTRYYCGKEEHKHTDDCYIEGTEPCLRL